MSRFSAIAALALLALPLSAELLPGLEQARPAGASAELLALGGVSPYAELRQAGLPLLPSPAECAALPALQFAQEQLAMKRVLLARALRSRAERNRISRENWLACAQTARELGAPVAFIGLLERRGAESLSRADSYLVDAALSRLLELYGVDELEIRFFAESRALPPDVAQADWFPMPLLFNLEPPAGVSAEAVAAHDAALLAALGELVRLYATVQDRASADAAAGAMAPALACFRQSLRLLGHAPDELRVRVRSRYAPLAGRIEGAWLTERKRVIEAGYFGSERLRALDFFMD